ncbi:hypothetical protein V5799_006608 [Amblyomma americanum]|uniref:Uncharacterized protein n=1 Tax=Amblyomma americanum TaxID=6943 RepID=A0AAQ4DVX2_AMBAM
MPATAPVSSHSTASHRGLPAVPEPVPERQQRTLPPATTRSVSSAVATHPGGAPNANNTGITSTGAWTGSLHDAASNAHLSTSNAASTPATGSIQSRSCTEPTELQQLKDAVAMVATSSHQLVETAVGQSAALQRLAAAAEAQAECQVHQAAALERWAGIAEQQLSNTVASQARLVAAAERQVIIGQMIGQQLQQLAAAPH